MATQTEMLKPKGRTQIADTSTDFDAAGVPTPDGPIGEEDERKNVLIPIFASILFCIAIIGIITMIIVVTGDSSDENPSTAAVSYSNDEFEEIFMEIPSNDSCYAYSETFASKPHVAGMQQTRALGAMFGEVLTDLGYEVIYDDIPNVVLDHYNSSSLSINNHTVDLSQPAIPGQNETFSALRNKAGIAFTPSGDHTAPLLYVNMGLDSDYETLRSEFGIDFNNSGVGYIALAKRLSPAYQALSAGKYGLKAIILFEDRYESDSSLLYPYTSELPNFSHRMDGRAYINRKCAGNPDINRLEEQCGFNFSESQQGTNTIFPAMYYNVSMIGISPDTAIEIFQRMRDESNVACNRTLPSEWNTSLPIDECLGGTDEVMATMVTSNELHRDDVIQNVYGFLEGDAYPDEIVMIGAHRDAWGLGACDDISGTVTVLEIARSLSVLRDEYGWKPKRSLMFGSWDAEEWGLYGSIDFNEGDNQWKDRVVAYLNFDMTVVGGGLRLDGNPMFRELLLDTAQQIDYPYPEWTQFNKLGDDSDSFTLFDTWWDYNVTDEYGNSLNLIACVTDFCPFEFYSGVPSLGINFISDFSMATTYHTFYDLNGWLDIVDPKWKFAETIAIYGGLLMLKIAQQDLLPFDIRRISIKMEEWATVDLAAHIEDLENTGNCTFNVAESGMEDLESSIGNLVEMAMDFEDVYNETLYQINAQQNTDGLIDRISSINSVLRNVMKIFINSDGIPSSKWHKLLLWKEPGGIRFPYIWDLLNDGCEDTDDAKLEEAFQVTVDAITELASLLGTVQ